MRSSVGLVCAALGLAACAGQEAQMTSHVAAELARGARHPISVFGVFRDGRMNTKAWDDLAPTLASLGPARCGAAYEAELVTNAADLATAVDETTRRYGVADSLLEALGPAAEADLILVFVVSGSLPSRRAPPEGPRPAPSGPAMARMPRGAYVARVARRDPGGLEVTVTLYSKTRRAQVAAISLRYTGASEKEAMARVDEKLGELVPGATCAGWDFSAHPIDPDVVRSLPEE